MKQSMGERVSDWGTDRGGPGDLVTSGPRRRHSSQGVDDEIADSANEGEEGCRQRKWEVQKC